MLQWASDHSDEAFPNVREPRPEDGINVKDFKVVKEAEAECEEEYEEEYEEYGAEYEGDEGDEDE